MAQQQIVKWIRVFNNRVYCYHQWYFKPPSHANSMKGQIKHVVMKMDHIRRMAFKDFQDAPFIRYCICDIEPGEIQRDWHPRQMDSRYTIYMDAVYHLKFLALAIEPRRNHNHLASLAC